LPLTEGTKAEGVPQITFSTRRQAHDRMRVMDRFSEVTVSAILAA
jgi:hypothetical protein